MTKCFHYLVELVTSCWYLLGLISFNLLYNLQEHVYRFLFLDHIGGAQGLLFVGLWEPYVALRIKTGLATCKTSNVIPILSLLPTVIFLNWCLFLCFMSVVKPLFFFLTFGLVCLSLRFCYFLLSTRLLLLLVVNCLHLIFIISMWPFLVGKN